MKKLGNKFPTNAELKSMFNTIMSYIKGNLCYGVQFNVSGLLHKGRVRIYYNRGSDYFDIELLRARKDEVVYECEDLDFTQLHNVLHQHIERTDDPEC